LCNGFVRSKAPGETKYDRPALPTALNTQGVAVIAEAISAMCAHQSLASPRPGLLLTDLNSNERGDTHEGSVLMLGSSSQRFGVVRSYPRKSQIIREDDSADHVYEVVSGTVCTCKMLREGRRQIAGFYFAEDVFGLESVKKHSVAVEAITNAQVRIFKKRALTALASSNLEVADRLLALTTRELARKQDHLLLLLSTNAEERIISFLIEMVQRASPREDDLIHLPMARRDIADYLGLTIETVSRVLWDFERRGAIEISGRHSIVLRNQSTNGRGERPTELFEGVNGRRPKTEEELQEWLVSSEGKAATLFSLTSLSRWGERARC